MKLATARTYNRILDLGLDMLSVTGLSGVTFGGLADEVGMSKSGLFAHFRSKEDIQLRLMQHAEKLVLAHVVAPAMEAAEGLPRLEALMKRWLGWTREAGLRGGCPMASAMFELDDLDGEVRGFVIEVELRSCGLLASLVREAIQQGSLRDDVDIDQFVWELRGIYLSHHVSSRFISDPLADLRAWTAFENVMARALR